MATNAERMTQLEDQMGAIAGMLSQLTAPQAAAPNVKPTAKDKAAQTQARTDTIKRALDHETVLVDNAGVEIVADGKTGLYRRGSRVKMVRNGKTQVGSLDRSEVLFVRDHADEIIAAMDNVDKAAKIGQHLPATDKAQATS